ncbi:DUF4231 domain-containing protein [Vibrio parahaemolyticus]|uniref:DUF4231 domain-containing protein n=1 Tax=Vibrio aestuarianus TaxID=28171 RepID=A0A9X4EU16_9VIBR|nr:MULTISPECIES: DUF4231 domain-containing protein [Vibrio]EIE1316224.1 DUF4231 domain-containing protein [Vibrio parahaemolyticus]EJC6878666.1 DUF4231 domain-containing protein [Vibrio parahaemolyticus]EJC6888168.1 DUF4231 domain-containing protein [Vibrio parahaemolyticus]MCA3988402.1 DUF4231 domain-containing protein [Vibrio vulnificus]MDE1242364.1 DUF4231 domain-containing protein [Vibrio aestuarianus]
MKNISLKYPALFKSADNTSATSQKRFLGLTVFHALVLLVGTLLSINVLPTKEYSMIVAVFYILALVLSYNLGKNRYEKSWYNGRAIAESIKTSTWKYCMRATPYVDDISIQIPNANFRNMLTQIIRSNNELGEIVQAHQSTDEQITTTMQDIRKMNLEDRKAYYLTHRIDEQRQWYATKASYNNKMHNRWFIGLMLTQGCALLCVLLRIAYPEWQYWPTDVFALGAAFIIGWTQIKKHNELSSSYSLTAQEIGIIRGGIEEVVTEEQFSEYVSGAEMAFSREHTQWIARQNY